MRRNSRAQASRCDLYVHAARIEVEGLSALEVLRLGVVPVIARGPLTATSQFALSGDSMYEAGDARALARAIDSWVERGSAARAREARRYVALARDMTFVSASIGLEESLFSVSF